MKYFYTAITLGLGSVISIAVSLGCSFWFFYSLSGADGRNSVLAGIAGCAIQLFGYGFAASYIRLSHLSRSLLCFAPLALSILTTYVTLSGYIDARSSEKAFDKRAEAIALELLEQSKVDREIVSSAATKSVDANYRKQSLGFFELNKDSREKDEALLRELKTDRDERNDNLETPLTSLLGLAEHSYLAVIIFCSWFALMFDILPVIAISRISKLAKNIENHRLLDNQPIAFGESDDTVAMSATKKDVNNPQVTLMQNEVRNDDKLLGSEDEIIEKICSGDIKPSKREIVKISPLSETQIENLLDRCLDNGIIARSGRGFQLKANGKALATSL